MSERCSATFSSSATTLRAANGRSGTLGREMREGTALAERFAPLELRGVAGMGGACCAGEGALRRYHALGAAQLADGF